MGILRTTFVPVLIVVAMERGLADITVPVLILACAMSPLAILAHELGHAVTGRLLGLEVSTVSLGVGPRLWRGEIFGTYFVFRTWPLSGLTFLGSASLEFLRLRLWLTTLMGPATNIALAAWAVLKWEEWSPVLSVSLLSLWSITNAWLALQSLVPKRFTQGGEKLSTDGLALLRIPFLTTEQLEAYLFTAPLLRGYIRFEDGDYTGARNICSEALERVPGNLHLRMLMSTCRSYQHDYGGALQILRPLLKSQSDAEAGIRAAIENNTAFALLMSCPQAAPDSETLAEADRLSARVFAMYPCVLAYRSTRALVLAATGRHAQALSLLRYAHYERADTTQRGYAETTRAFAFDRSNRPAEARIAAAAAVRLNAHTAGFLQVLGVPAPPPLP